MSSRSDRVNHLIQEHSSLSKHREGQDETQQDARVKEIRQELVQIFTPDTSGPED